MIKCAKCGISTTNARMFFPLLNSTGTYSWFCKTCIRPQIRQWNLPCDLTNLDDSELRRGMESVNAMVHNVVFNDRAHLQQVFDHLQATMKKVP